MKANLIPIALKVTGQFYIFTLKMIHQAAPHQACDFTNDFDNFAKLDTKIVGISPDNSASHQKFIDKFNLKITLLSDPEKQIIKAYGAWG